MGVTNQDGNLNLKSNAGLPKKQAPDEYAAGMEDEYFYIHCVCINAQNYESLIAGLDRLVQIAIVLVATAATMKTTATTFSHGLAMP